MARGARGVTCRECGCLNFSSEHDVCDSCRSKPLAFRPTARRVAASALSAAANGASNSRRNEDSLAQSKKRRLEDSKNASNKRHAEDKPKPKPKPAPAKARAKTQPDVIDLISDDEEEDDVQVQKVVQQSLESHRQEQQGRSRREEEALRKQLQDEQRALFQSRVFPSTTFRESDFPSMEAGALMRKRAAERGVAQSQPTSAGAAQAKQRAHTSSASQPAPVVARDAKEKQVHPKPAEPRPPPAVVVDRKGAEKETQTQTQKAAGELRKRQALDARPDSTAGKRVQATVDANASLVVNKSKAVEEKTAEKEDPLFQSRVFEPVEFQAADFVTVFDGLAVARRSHPPTVHSAVAAGSNAATSMTVGSGAATAPVSTKSNGGIQLAQASTAAMPPLPSTTKPAFISAVAKDTTEAKAAATLVKPKSQSAVSTPPIVVSTIAPPVKSSSTSAPPDAANPVPNPTTATGSVATVSSVASKRTSKVPPTTVQASSVSGAAVATITGAGVSKAAAVPSTSPPVSAPVASRPAPSVSTTTKPTPTTTATAPKAPSSAPASATNASQTKDASSTSATDSEQTQSNGNANVLLPKKKHPEAVPTVGEERRHSESPAAVLSEVDGVEFVKVTAAPFEVVRDVPVETPVLGYCSPDFLSFMRECGGEDVDEEDDPEEVSRSQLKLLNIVDLTNLSDSEGIDSDSESPAPTPRAATAEQKHLPMDDQVGGAGQPTPVAATPIVSGKGTWYVPTLDSEPKRTKPEKVMCELCEESGVPSRLIRCPTCTKYYHKKCAKENGDENICWNCELGSMIDDSELDAEHDKHDSEYLAYLRAIRRASSPASGEDEEEGDEEEEENEEDEVEEVGENQQDGDEGAADSENVEMATTEEGDEAKNPFAEGNSSHNPGKKRWMEFIGGATADIDATFHEVTNRIAEELRDEEKKQLYSRGFVSRAEFEAQMTEVEEYYITEEARLQQLEREKAIEAKKAAEARKAQAAAEQAAASAASNRDQPATGDASATTPAPVLPTAVQATTPSAPTSNPPPPSTISTAGSAGPPSNAPAAAPAAPSAGLTATQTAATAPSFTALPTSAFAAAFKAVFSRPKAAGAPPRAPQP